MRIGEQKIIDELEYKIQMGKELLDHFLPKDEDNQTEKTNEAKAFIEQEISICETLVFCIKTGS